MGNQHINIIVCPPLTDVTRLLIYIKDHSAIKHLHQPIAKLLTLFYTRSQVIELGFQSSDCASEIRIEVSNGNRGVPQWHAKLTPQRRRFCVLVDKGSHL